MLEDVEAVLRSELVDAGSEGEFWSRVERSGTPRIEPVDDQHVRMTLLHRPQHKPARVYVDASSLTNHHAPQLTTMTRLDDTGIWFWSITVARTWRGSYRFMPVSSAVVDELDPPGIAETVDGTRSRFLGLYEHRVADEFNPHRLGRGSLAEMPDAPVQRWWNDGDLPAAQPRPLNWRSELLGNTRRAWVHETPGDLPGPDRPLVIVLDGEQWVEENPLAPILDRAAAQQLLPAAVVVFVDSIDGEARGSELPCNRRFWEAVIGELLPLVAEHAEFTADPRRTVVSGQSYGGLASTFAALEFPERFGRVSCQSGSFWWPVMFDTETNAPGPDGGRIAELLEPRTDLGTVVVDMTVGLHEGFMVGHNRHVAKLLQDRGAGVRYDEFDGGHDWVCWRGELVESLIRLLEETHHASDEADDDNQHDDSEDAEKNDR